MKLGIAVCSLFLSMHSLSFADSFIDAFDRGQYESAKSGFEQRLEANTKDPISLFYLGRIALLQDRLDDAESLLTKTLEYGSGSAEQHYWLAVTNARQVLSASIFSKMGYARKTRKQFELSVKKDPEFIPGYKGLIAFYIRAPAIAGGSIKKARANAETLKQLNEIEGLGSLMNIALKEDQVDQAVAIADSILLNHKDSQSGLFQAGMTYQQIKEFQKAHQALTLSASQPIDDKESKQRHFAAIYQLGRNAALGELNIEEGIDALEKYISAPYFALNPNKQFAQIRLAELLILRGGDSEARVLLDEVLRNPVSQEARSMAEKVQQNI